MGLRRQGGILLSETTISSFNFIINLPPDDVFSNAYVRPFVARRFGIQCGKYCWIKRGIYFEHWKNLRLGENVWLNKQSYIDAFAGIIIGNNIRLGPQVMLITGGHEMSDPNMRAGATIGSPIVIEDGCWVGARVTITAGVTIGKDCVISAGSVVQRSMPPNSLIAGNPARPIAQLAGADNLKT